MNPQANMDLTVKVWRQSGPEDKGRMESYQVEDISPDMSFLEMMDILNVKLIQTGKDPIAFDHDCREGICGSCNMMINGQAHGPVHRVTTCQLHMRSFNDGDTIVVEPWRARAFPVIKDLVVDRSGLDDIMHAGGFVSVNTGNSPDANAVPVSKEYADSAMDAASCIGCGACVATCKNASAFLFMSAKVSQLAYLPQGDPERQQRVRSMLDAHDEAGFGYCSNTGACQVQCPKDISIKHIARLNGEYIKATVVSEK